ncbi:hypothetical protein N9181_00155 [bacterium]|nr:hypothetical protein [bacterium]
MPNSIRPAIIAGAMLLASIATAADTTSTKEEFHEFAEFMTGRFRSEIRLIHDWPGHDKKKGDQISGIRTGRRIADGEGFICTDDAGTGSLTEIFLYNSLTNQIECTGVANGGTTWTNTIWKSAPNRWSWNLTASLKDGTPIKGSGAWVIMDDGKQIDFVSDNFMIGDTKADKLHDHYHRVSN